jgi:surface antigen
MPPTSRRLVSRSAAGVLLVLVGVAVAGCAGQSTPSQPSTSGPPATSAYADDYPYPSAVIDTVNPRWNFFYRECTDFIAWRMNRDGGTTSDPYFFTNNMSGGRWGNAENWDVNAQPLGFVVDHSPTVGAIAQWHPSELTDASFPGHVAYVERVNADGTIDVTEYNFRVNHGFGFRLSVPPAPRYIHVRRGSTPTANRPPVVTGVSVSPQGMGIESATIFTFTAQGVSDPDGDTLTYSWVSSDGSTVISNTQAAAQAYTRTGTFDMRVTVTDPKGLSASAVVSVTVGNVTGVWDITCARSAMYPEINWPIQWVATLVQTGQVITGNMSAAGRQRNFTFPGSVTNPRSVAFGTESGDTAGWGDMTDFYWHMTVNDTLTSMTGSGSVYCTSSSSGRKR